MKLSQLTFAILLGSATFRLTSSSRPYRLAVPSLAKKGNATDVPTIIANHSAHLDRRRYTSYALGPLGAATEVTH